MLTARRLLPLLAAISVLLVEAPVAVALADGGVQCPPQAPDCVIDVNGPGHGGGGTGTGGSSGGGGSDAAGKCFAGGQEVPCYRDGLGWFNSFDSCYYQLMDPQPPADDPIWQGPIAVYAKAYQVTCPYSSAPSNNNRGVRILSTPPPGYGGPTVDAAQLAQDVVKKMLLKGPDIGIAPKSGGVSLVGLPVWLWDNVSGSTWGPKSDSASAGGVTVTASALVDKIDWSMGDGTTEVCRTAGVPYDPSYGARKPDCGHTYTKVSGASPYQITATSTWIVTWTSSTGQSGTITTTRQSSTTAAIAEMQTVNNN